MDIKKKYCIYCGEKLDERARFCPQCGNKVKESQESYVGKNNEEIEYPTSNYDEIILPTQIESDEDIEKNSDFIHVDDSVLLEENLSQSLEESSENSTIGEKGSEEDKSFADETKEDLQDNEKEIFNQIHEKEKDDNNQNTVLERIKSNLYNIGSDLWKILLSLFVVFFVLCLIALRMNRKMAALVAIFSMLLMLGICLINQKRYNKQKKLFKKLILGLTVILLIPYAITFEMDYSDGHHYTWKEIAMYFRTIGEEKSIIPFSSDGIKNEFYLNVEKTLSNAGFYNLEVIPLKDLETKSELDGHVASITIDNMSQFESRTRFPSSSKILVEYHAYAEESLPITSNMAKGKSYDEIEKIFKKSLFYDVEEKLISDTEEDNKNNDEVEYIEVNGNRDYVLQDSYPINSHITIYHSLKKEKLPIKLEEIKGKSYEEVLNIFNDSNFMDIESKIIEDQDDDNIVNDEMEYIEVVGKADLTNETKISIASKIILYHSYKREYMPITSEKVKNMSYDDAQKLFVDTIFTNIKNVSDIDINEKNKKEFFVTKIVIDGKENYTMKDKFPFNKEIKIYYEQKKYEVTLQLEGKNKSFFSTNDANIFVDHINVGKLKNDKTTKIQVSLPKGKHTLEVILVDDDGIKAKKEFNIKGKRILRYKVSCKYDEVKIKYMKQLKVPYCNSDIKNKKAVDVQKEFFAAGFKKVDLVELNDLTEDTMSKKDMISKIVINDNEKFKKNDTYYSDAKVKIEYHSVKKIKTSISSSQAKKLDYQFVAKKLKEAGFVNISVEKYKGKYDINDVKNTLQSIKIGEDDIFFEDTEYPYNIQIVIYYYSLDYEKVSVGKMINDYKENSYNAEKYYQDRLVSVTGIVEKIDKSGNTFYIRKENDSYSFEFIECEVSDKSQKDIISKLKAGKKVTIKGKVTWVLGMWTVYTVKAHDIIIH